MRRKSLTILIIFATVLFIGYCSWQIITTLQERYLSKQEYERTRESYVSAITPPEETEEEEVVDDGWPKITIDVEGLLAQNPDFTSWLYYEDAAINYPIVQETKLEMNKYLKTTFEGNSNPSGCAFIPFDADPDFRYMNTFVYGHNMMNGTMFGTLKQVYQYPAKCLNPYFYVWTREHETIKYRVIAAYVVDQSDEMYSIPLTAEAYSDYVNKALQHGAMNKYVPFEEAEKTAMNNAKPIVTLSTCYGAAGTSKRLLVQGVELERKPFE